MCQGPNLNGNTYNQIHTARAQNNEIKQISACCSIQFHIGWFGAFVFVSVGMCICASFAVMVEKLIIKNKSW